MICCSGRWGFHHIPPLEDLDGTKLLTGTNSKPGLCHSKIVGILEVVIYQLLVSYWGLGTTWMNAWQTCLKGLLWSTSLSSTVQVTGVTSWLWNLLLLSAVLIWPAWGGLPAYLGSYWPRIWWGAGNSQVTVNEWDCFFVYQISHHNVNSERSAQPKPPIQLPNYGDFRLQKQVCKKCRQKIPSPLPSPYSPLFLHCEWDTHIHQRKSWVLNMWLYLVFVQCQIANGPGKGSPNCVVGAPVYSSLSQTTCDKAVFWEILTGLCGKTNLQAAASVPTCGDSQCVWAY